MCPRPRPRSFASRAGPQPQGVQLTFACPGPTSWPNGQRRGRWSNICTGTRWSCPRRPRRNPPACPVLRSSRTPRSWRQTGFRPSRAVRTMAVLPRPIRPMLATLRRSLPADQHRYGWEFKCDGVRAIAYVSGGEVRLVSRNDKDMAASYPELAVLAARCPGNPGRGDRGAARRAAGFRGAAVPDARPAAARPADRRNPGAAVPVRPTAPRPGLAARPFLGSGCCAGGWVGHSRMGASQRRRRGGVNVQRPQRSSAGTNDVGACKARRSLNWPGEPGGWGRCRGGPKGSAFAKADLCRPENAA